MWDLVWSTGAKEKAEETIFSRLRKSCIRWALLWPTVMAF